MKYNCSTLALGLLALVLTPGSAVAAAQAGRGGASEEWEVRIRQQTERIEKLEATIAEQAKQLEALHSQHSSEPDQEESAIQPEGTGTTLAATQQLDRISGELAAVTSTTDALEQRLTDLNDTVHNSNQANETELRSLGPFHYSGDVRLRYEPFFGGTLAASRNRTRFRLRFNAQANLSDEISGGFALGSGDELDPISTNQTLGGFLQRKPISIDRAFFQYDPNWLDGFRVVAGKFAYPWYRTELTFDNDLNPEGVAQVMDFNFTNPVLKRLSFVGIQMPVRETGSGADTAMFGGQIGSQWQLGSRIRFSSYAAFYDWRRTDAIRAAQTADNLSGSSNSNAATDTQYASKFGILDVIARFDVATGSTRWPLMLQFDFANNTRACTNLPADVVPCNPRDRSAYWAEAQLGQTRERGDVQFGYTFARLESESVLSPFNFSDLRAPTNSVTHRLNFGYQVDRNVTLNYTALIGRHLVGEAPPATEPWLKRMQADLVYRF